MSSPHRDTSREQDPRSVTLRLYQTHADFYYDASVSALTSANLTAAIHRTHTPRWGPRRPWHSPALPAKLLRPIHPARLRMPAAAAAVPKLRKHTCGSLHTLRPTPGPAGILAKTSASASQICTQVRVQPNEGFWQFNIRYYRVPTPRRKLEIFPITFFSPRHPTSVVRLGRLDENGKVDWESEQKMENDERCGSRVSPKERKTCPPYAISLGEEDR